MRLPRRSKPKTPTSRQLVIGGAVVVVVAQVIALGLTGHGDPQPIIPERWYRRRDR